MGQIGLMKGADDDVHDVGCKIGYGSNHEMEMCKINWINDHPIHDSREYPQSHEGREASEEGGKYLIFF